MVVKFDVWLKGEKLGVQMGDSKVHLQPSLIQNFVLVFQIEI